MERCRVFYVFFYIGAPAVKDFSSFASASPLQASENVQTMHRSSEVSCMWGSISPIPLECPEGSCNPPGGMELVLEFSDCTHSGLGQGEKLWFLFRVLLTYLQRCLVWPDRLRGGVNYCRGRSAQRCLYCTFMGFPLDLTWYFYTYLPWSLSASISTLRTRQTCRQCKWSLLHPRQSPRNHSSCGPSSHLSLFLFFLLITSLSPSSPLLLSLWVFFTPLPHDSLRLCVSVPLPGSRSLETGLVAWLPSAAWAVFWWVHALMRAHGYTWGIFYEVEIRWHLIDRHGLHGYLGDRVVGRDTYSSLGLSDHSWEK